MRASNFLLLALMQGAAATAGILIVNPYTSWGQPPPDCVACSSNDDCQSSCTNAYCNEDFQQISGNCPLNWCVEEDHAPEAVVCDNPKANGFIKCEDGTLYRHCSPSNRDGGMYYTTEIPPPHSPPAPPAPPQPPPDFATSTEGQLLFGACALIFILIVGTVRFSLGLSLLAHLRASHANRWMWCFPRMADGLPVPRALEDGFRSAQEVGGRREQGHQRTDAQGTWSGGTLTSL